MSVDLYPKRKINFLIAALLPCLLMCSRLTAQIGGNWMWVDGSSTTNSAGVYGPKGVPSAPYTPGARESHSGARNAGGNFWMFGGEDVNQNLYNDLWLYNPGNETWEWVSGGSTVNNHGVYGTKGTFSAANVPGARMGQSITADNNGFVWVFGGYGFDGAGNLGLLNDLWKFNPYTSQWAWIAGNNTVNAQPIYTTLLATATAGQPGSRDYPSIAADASGDIWVFGGSGYDANGNKGSMDDLWKYSTSGYWVWYSGYKTRNAPGFYNGKGNSGIPGGRYEQSMVIDASGNLWLFGGTDGSNHYFDDLWKTPITSGTWTWVGGDATINNAGVYGTRTVTAATDLPGSRSAATLLFDGATNFWLFGGYGYDVNTNPGLLNDLWQYSSTTGQWTWVAGDDTRNQAAVYGAINISAAANKPSGRQMLPGFIDLSGNVYIMGGGNSLGPDNNDVWEFSPAYYTLAIKTVTLQAVPNSSGNVLTWQTRDEIDTKTFVVEKSTDGAVFTDISSVPAVGSGSNKYTFTDTHPLPGNAFYRLKVIDLDGNVDYSSIVVLTNSTIGKSLSVYPNPATTTIIINIGDDALLNTPAKLFDLSGRLLCEEMITARQQYFNLGYFPAGVYILQFSNGTCTRIAKD